MNSPESDSFNARRADPRELYERTGLFGGPKRKFRLALICAFLAIIVGGATGKWAPQGWIRTFGSAVAAVLFLLALFLARWSSGEDLELRKPIVKERPKLWP